MADEGEKAGEQEQEVRSLTATTRPKQMVRLRQRLNNLEVTDWLVLFASVSGGIGCALIWLPLAFLYLAGIGWALFALHLIAEARSE